MRTTVIKVRAAEILAGESVMALMVPCLCFTIQSHLVIMRPVLVVFFFQAEDGIRDDLVTGVQTCALPIFYPHTNDAFLTVGVFLDEITSANGPLLCLPGSHQGKIYDHYNPDTGYFCSAVDLDADPVNATGAEECIGPAGAVSFHHVRTLHASGPNMSAQARRLLLIGYAAADAWPLLGVKDWDQIGRASCRER